MSRKINRPTHIIPHQVAIKLLENHRDSNCGRAFTVVFTKRSDGTKRTMNARYNVVSKLKTGVAAYDAEDHDLHAVYDLVQHDYRSINLDTLEKVVMDGVSYEVV